MKFVCSKTNLVNGLQIVSKAVPSKTTMSILECIFIDVTEGIIKFIANDMELGIQTIVEGNILERGYIAIDAKLLVDIIRKLPDNDVTIESDSNNKVTISCEKAKFNLIGRKGDDFTHLPSIEKIDGVNISQYTLKNVIQKTIFSIAENDANKMMGGELFEVDGENLKLVALDGHRISIRKVKLNGNFNYKKVIVPGKTLGEISKILGDNTEKIVSIFFTDKHILFEFEKTTVVSRLIEGEYFSIDQMLSSDYETKISVNRKELLECIDRATLLVKEGDKKPVIIAITEGKMELKINSAIGSMDEEIDIDKQGKDLMIGFNPKFLIDALRAIEDEIVEIYLVNPKAPCFLRDKDSTYTYLVLPVNFTTVD
ncbi:DNA polymerase III subunit beta [Butyrivibrio sp. YAB3001]|uniref:DNA polymerase III subunit beta n=1 Tax=Butyrivibrio sp. YAB3001 TaxID=1520812 RepID=UPI0008F63E7C|nr:DNA polymerase III subunit beta [Butyrivibrio sp. YAB3001]SFC85006.1 DNA polymerase-3 subunit beta [Butyrivibrio sp. YAB3001]